MKRLALVAFAAAFLVPATAHAAVPCRDWIYNDWYKDGKIASTYPIACYRDALKHVPADARTYSSLADDIHAAELGAVARLHGQNNVPAQIGKGGTGAVSPATATIPAGSGHGDQTQDNAGVTDTTASGTVAAAAAASSGGGIPLPILILGGIAIALVAIGAIGTGVRRFRRTG